MDDIISAIVNELHKARVARAPERDSLGIHFSPDGFKQFKAHPGVKAVIEYNPGTTRVLGMPAYLNEDQQELFIIKRG